ncbi:ATP-dependent DNA ligase [Rhodococcus spelaei]|uniref:DNA ligase (ATP) n=1 Tax=Rhodococcus spelaei TaxID=2546320 RepID=A0A541B2C3_9NOCA|nr:non-homologous end-joining DNA ligase [Rhodococcus spelaei]TQF66466.1 ATP-dependent DNA ligase [Rhodococcus spelaei]
MSHDAAVVVGGKRLSLTNLDKVLYPETGTTKAEVLQYFTQVGAVMVPLLAGRPVTRKRWPDGTAATPFFQKNVDSATPAWVERRTMTHGSKTIAYPLVDDLAALVYFAQSGSLEFHVPQWRFGADGQPMHPDRLVVDLDPGPGVSLEQCAEVALRVRERLQRHGLDALPVTSGSKGIHLYSGLAEGWTSQRCVEFAKAIAVDLERETPKTVISKMTRAQRDGKVFVDWSQNSASKTTVSPYSLRGTARPTVAAPRTWAELAAAGLRQLDFGEVLGRLESGVAPAVIPAQAPKPPAATRLPRSTVDLQPMLASRSTAEEFAPRADPTVWAFEYKLDGYRALVYFEHDAGSGPGSLRLVSRNGQDLTPTFPELGQVPAGLRGHTGVLDGEIVVCDEEGAPSFGLLQQRIGRRGGPGPAARLLLFDVLELDGTDLAAKPFRDRRTVLEAIPLDPADSWHVPDLAPADLAEAFERSRVDRMEGLVAKRWDSSYRPGRSPSWVKLKHFRECEVVVGGWQPGEGGRARGIGSLLLGVPDENGGLRYVGKVGSGFSDATLTELGELTGRLSSEQSPFLTDIDVPGARWVRPELVAEVRYSELTGDGKLRHPVWRGLRRDKNPDQVVGAGSG